MLFIEELDVCVKNKIIIRKLNLSIKPGDIHVIMGPNGSGKSTLSVTIAGKSDYKVTHGKIFFKNKNLLLLNPEERAGEGIFVAFQYPIEIPGISNQDFLHAAVNSVRKYRNQPLIDRFDFLDFIQDKISLLNMPSDLLHRSVNVGFSGGEKKRNDILQMIVLDPQLCILDETDSGLDIDAVKIIADGINMMRDSYRIFIIITHYQRILEYIKPDYVHIIYEGSIIKSGDISLAKELEGKGYGWLTKQ